MKHDVAAITHTWSCEEKTGAQVPTQARRGSRSVRHYHTEDAAAASDGFSTLRFVSITRVVGRGRKGGRRVREGGMPCAREEELLVI